MTICLYSSLFSDKSQIYSDWSRLGHVTTFDLIAAREGNIMYKLAWPNTEACLSTTVQTASPETRRSLNGNTGY